MSLAHVAIKGFISKYLTTKEGAGGVSGMGVDGYYLLKPNHEYRGLN